MNNRILRFLVLACSVTLALPHGWCCIFAAQKFEKQTARSEAVHGSTGGEGSGSCCCPGTTPQTSQPSSSSDSSPSAPSPIPFHCPCTERNATSLKNAVEKFGADFAFVAILPINDILLNETVKVVEVVACFDFSPPRSLHVLHCRWLC
jgi:hypothetical protein